MTAGRTLAALRFNAVPFYEPNIDCVGHAEQWDRLDVDGDPVATVDRDRDSLEAELAFEHDIGA
jgi:3-phenylpropionate/trans-cinnamate dioxygenase ferredoxin reductase subunit